MSVQDALGYVAGTPITWKSSTGTKVITCTSLAAAASRQGDKSPTLVVSPPGLSTAILPDFLQVILQLQFTSAATAGKTVDLYFGFSDSATAATDNPGGLTGVDGAGPNADVFPQLAFVGSLVASANLSTAVQLQYLTTRPLDAYFSPVIVNSTDVAFDATALHTILTVVPYYSERST